MNRKPLGKVRCVNDDWSVSNFPSTGRVTKGKIYNYYRVSDPYVFDPKRSHFGYVRVMADDGKQYNYSPHRFIIYDIKVINDNIKVL